MSRHQQIVRMDDFKDYELDLRRTLVSNMVILFFITLILIYIITSMKYLQTIEDPTISLIFVIVFTFALIKLMGMISYPNLHFAPRINIKKNERRK